VSLKTEWIRFGSENEYQGLFARAERATAPLPGVLVIQEAWGVDGHIEDITRRIALAGYAAFAPDLFARSGERPPALTPDRLAETVHFMNALSPAARADAKLREEELRSRPKADADRIAETLTTLFRGGFLPPVLAAASFMRNQHPATRGQKLASIGFCMGGGLSASLACNDPRLAGAIMFYGRPPPLEEVARIHCPVLAFYGERDIPLIDAMPAFADAMKKNGKSLEMVTYENAEHAFFNDTRPTYDVAAARDAFARTLEFLLRTLSA